jgi:antibiotic biosynthesis monooxygenase (ABM) superfamily enzyme
MSNGPVPGAVTVLVSRRVRPGQSAGFTATMQTMLQAAQAFPGHLGGQLMLPQSDDPPDLAHVVFAFDNEAHLQAWQQSPERARCLQALEPFIVGATQVHRVPGLELWFAPGSGAARPAPPRWKVAVVTWLGICPTVWLLSSLLASPLASWPSLPRVMLLTALIVVAMTWWVAPALTRWMAPWLYAQFSPVPP